MRFGLHPETGYINYLANGKTNGENVSQPKPGCWDETSSYQGSGALQAHDSMVFFHGWFTYGLVAVE